MSLLDISSETLVSSNPVDMIEHVASDNDWMFERSTDDEITISIGGRWTDYHVSFSWMEEFEALHLACAFDLKIPAAKTAEIAKLLVRINEHQWLGHFDLWNEGGAVLYRTSLLLSGGAEVNPQQCADMLSHALEACERYYQAFQFVVWAGKSAAEAFETAMFETAGEA
jgi:hypothetical protein